MGTSTFSKDETKDKLKALIEEYAREVENNLKSIEGLTEIEIGDLMHQEMIELADYIPKCRVSKE